MISLVFHGFPLIMNNVNWRPYWDVKKCLGECVHFQQTCCVNVQYTGLGVCLPKN